MNRPNSARRLATLILASIALHGVALAVPVLVRERPLAAITVTLAPAVSTPAPAPHQALGGERDRDEMLGPPPPAAAGASAHSSTPEPPRRDVELPSAAPVGRSATWALEQTTSVPSVPPGFGRLLPTPRVEPPAPAPPSAGRAVSGGEIRDDPLPSVSAPSSRLHVGDRVPGGPRGAVTITPRDARGEEGGATASLVSEAAAGADGDVREGIGTAAGERTERALATLVVPGSSAASGDPAGEYASYLQRLRGVLQGSIQYPAGARRRGLTGTVRVQIVVQPTGDVESAILVGSSSHLLLDQAALEAVRALRPLPFPPELPRRALRVELPIVFELR